jgi:formylglycine-generating enzyme required for sulfatase activity
MLEKSTRLFLKRGALMLGAFLFCCLPLGFSQPMTFQGSQQITVSGAHGGIYAWNFTTSWNHWEEHTGNFVYSYPVPAGEWVGLFLYDYTPPTGWKGAYYCYVENWSALAMVTVPAGTFTMGRRDDGDDASGSTNELPRHEVTLSGYEIGKYEVTNRQVADVYNWALGQGYLENISGGAYTGGTVYVNSVPLLETSTFGHMQYSAGAFTWRSRPGTGGTYSMADHPVIAISWHGAVAFCNWLSEMQGLTPAYDISTWDLVDGDLGTAGTQFTSGYRLPTEAEWERAAAWDGAKHWIYGFASDTLTGSNRCNYGSVDHVFAVNPLGLADVLTSPIGWFDGTNVSPNGSVQTMDSVNSLGLYDMSGNAAEWCHDWYDIDYYDGGAMVDPIGPPSGSSRIERGGSWYYQEWIARSAFRGAVDPVHRGQMYGFRVARTP